MDTPAGFPNLVVKILLLCGILAPLVSLGTDRLAGSLLDGYSFSVQSMSELVAAGSPTRGLVLWLSLAGSLLLAAFAIGVWQVTAGVLPRIVAGLIIAHAAAGFTAALFFPNRFGLRPEFGTPGVLLMFLSVLSFVLAMIFGAFAFHGWMRILSIAIPAAYVLLAAGRIASAASSPSAAAVMIGVQERTMAYSFLLWVMALAIYLVVSEKVVAASHSIGI